jgi:hypothetical protein
MAKEPRRVKLSADTDIVGLAEKVKGDSEPRILERDGELVAAIVSIDDLNRMLLSSPSAPGIARALDAAGAWKDVDTDALVEKIYRARHESPPSAPVRL